MEQKHIMKVLLIKSCRDKLFFEVYDYLSKKYGDVNVVLKKDAVLKFACPSKFEYEAPKLLKHILESELKNLNIEKFEKVFFVVPDNTSNLIEYKNVYSFAKSLDTKKVYFIDAFLRKQPLNSWIHFYSLIFCSKFFKQAVKVTVLSVCLFSKLLKKFEHKVIVEKPRL